MLRGPRRLVPYAFGALPAEEGPGGRSVGCANILLRLEPETWEAVPVLGETPDAGEGARGGRAPGFKR
jgi:hypothetical protein